MHLLVFQRRDRARAGFNLIEVLVALAVVSIGLIAIIGLLPHALESARSSVDRTVAGTVVQQYFAEYRAGSYNNITNITDALLAEDGFATTPTNPPYFKVDITVEDDPGGLAVKLIAARVSWRYPNPLNSDVFLTEIARYEP